MTALPLPPPRSKAVCGTNTARQRPVAFENGVPNQGTWAKQPRVPRWKGCTNVGTYRYRENLRAGGPEGNRTSHRAFHVPVRADHRQRVGEHKGGGGNDMWQV